MSDDDNRREMSRLWRVYKTSKQMCHDRVSRTAPDDTVLVRVRKRLTCAATLQGYEIDEDELDISLAEFQDKCGDASGAAKYDTHNSSRYQHNHSNDMRTIKHPRRTR